MFTPNDTYDIINDIQRVENQCNSLVMNIKQIMGITLDLNIRTDWTREDIPTIEEMERIRSNVEKIFKCTFAGYSIKKFGNKFNYENANELEAAIEYTFDFLFRAIEIIYYPVANYYTANEPNFLLARRD